MQKSQHHLSCLFQSRPQTHEHLGPDTFTLAQETEEQVLGADVVVAELERLTHREFKNFLCPWGERRRTRRSCSEHANDLVHLLPHSVQRDVHLGEGLGGKAFTFLDESEEDVLGPYELMVQETRLFLGQHQDPTGTVSETLEHWP